MMRDYESEYLYAEELETQNELVYVPFGNYFNPEFTYAGENRLNNSNASMDHSQMLTLSSELAAETLFSLPDSEFFESERASTSFPESGYTSAEKVSFAFKGGNPCQLQIIILMQ